MIGPAESREAIVAWLLERGDWVPANRVYTFGRSLGLETGHVRGDLQALIKAGRVERRFLDPAERDPERPWVQLRATRTST